MIYHTCKFYLVLIPLLFSSGGFALQERSLAEPTCISRAEKELYNLIMAYRKEKGLATIPLSQALTRVAQAHVKDLSEHAPYK
jgi:uncharacterized protein YkwD